MEEITKKVISLVPTSYKETSYIIVPDRYSLIIESMLFDVLEISSTFNIKVIGINKLAKLILKENGLDDFAYSTEQSLLFTRKAIMDSSKDFTCFKKQLSTGFCEEIFSSITQFKTNKLSFDDVKNLANESNELIKYKLNDLAKIYENYEKLLNGRLDSSETLNVFESVIQDSNIIKNSNFFFVGFDSFTRQGYSLISKLGLYALKVVVGALSPKNQKNKFLFDNEVVNNINDFAKENGLIVNVLETYISNKDIHSHLKNNLFLLNPSVMDCEESPVSILECYGEKDEVNSLIKIVNSLLSQGYAFKDINIACPLEKYKQELKNAFNKLNFPYFLDENILLYDIFPIRMIIELLKVFDNPFENNIFSVLKNDYFFNDDSLIYKVENISLKNNLKFPSLLDFDYKLEEDVSSLKSLFKTLSNLYNQFSKNSKIENYISYVKNIYKTFNIDEKINSKLDNLEKIDLKTEKIYCQVTDAFNEVLDNLSLIKDENISFDDFLELFVFSLKNKSIKTIPIKVNTVFIGDAESGFFENRKFLFILGANQGEIPSSLNDCGVISDKEIDLLKDEVKITPTIAMINRRKRFKIYDLLSLFKEKLFVSYLAVNSDGSKNFISNFVLSLKKMFTVKGKELAINYSNYNLYFPFKILNDESFNQLKDNITDLTSLKTTLTKLVLNHDFELANLVYSVIKKFDKNFVFDFKTKNEKGLIKNAKELFFNKDKTKISQLEKYFHCPYAHFMDYGLKLKERETKEIQAKNIGTLLHAVAELFLKYNTDSLGNIDEKTIKNKVDNILLTLEKDENNKWLNFNENKYLYTLLKREALNLCIALNNQQKVSKFIPTYFEERFFENSNFKPLKINDLNLIGVVDRIDLLKQKDSTYFRVIDYKTGKIESGFSSVYFGDKIQLFIYQRAIEQATGFKPCGNLYYSVKDSFDEKSKHPFEMKGVVLNNVDIMQNMDNSISFDNPSSSFLPYKISTQKDNVANGEIVINKQSGIITEDDFKDISSYVLKLVSKAIKEIEDGYIMPSPIKDGCKYCKYFGACGFSPMLNNKERIQKAESVKIESFQGVDNE